MLYYVHTPPSTYATNGNMVTAQRYRCFLTEMGHDEECKEPSNADVLIVLHAHKSFQVVQESRSYQKIIVVLTGTDVSSWTREARTTCLRADVVVLLRELSVDEKSVCMSDERILSKSVIIHQTREHESIASSSMNNNNSSNSTPLRVLTIANLRQVKDPLAVHRALELKRPEMSAMLFTLIGDTCCDEKESCDLCSAAYKGCIGYVGPKNQADCTKAILETHVVVMPSFAEGLSDVFVQTIVNNVPLLCRRMDSTLSLLPDDYIGFFDTDQNLCDILERCRYPEFRYNLIIQTKHAHEILSDRSGEFAAWQKIIHKI
jgi:hypothetical protein